MPDIRELTAQVREGARKVGQSINGIQRIPVTVQFRGKRKDVGDGWLVFEGVLQTNASGYPSTSKIKATVDIRSAPMVTSIKVGDKELGGTPVESLFRAWMIADSEALKVAMTTEGIASLRSTKSNALPTSAGLSQEELAALRGG